MYKQYVAPDSYKSCSAAVYGSSLILKEDLKQ